MDQPTLIDSEGKAIGAGIKAPNEARKRLNLSPVEGGETPYLQQQNYSLAALAARDEAAINPPPVPVVPPPPPEEEDEEDLATAFLERLYTKAMGRLYEG